jgi:hypothetical protein
MYSKEEIRRRKVAARIALEASAKKKLAKGKGGKKSKAARA